MSTMKAAAAPVEKPAGLKRLERLAAAISRIGSVEFDALVEVLTEHGRDAQETAHGPDTPEANRSYWNGGDYCLCELRSKLTDLRSGAWRQWTDVRETCDRLGIEEE